MHTKWIGELPLALRFYVLHLWTIFGLALSNIFLGLSVLALPAAWKSRTAISGRVLTEAVAVPLFYAGSLLAAVALSYRPASSVGELSELFSLTSYLIAVLLIHDDSLIRRIVTGLIWVATLAAVMGLIQLTLGAGGLDERIRGPFSHYMTYAGVLLMADAFLLARLVAQRCRGKAYIWVALITINCALFASLTRSAWVAFFVALTVLLLVRAPRLTAAYVPAAVLFLLLAPVHVLQRAGSIFDLGDASNYDRLCMVEAGFRMITERPISGLGPSMVGEMYPIYRHPTAPRVETEHLHNSFVQLGAERGIPAVVILLVWFVGSGATALREFRRQGRFAGDYADLLLGVFLAIVAFAVAGCFEDNWGDTEVQRLLLFVLAVPYCLSQARTQTRLPDAATEYA